MDQRLATASTDGTVRLWKWHTGELIGILIEDEGEKLMALALSPDGSQLCGGGEPAGSSAFTTWTRTEHWFLSASHKALSMLLLFWDNIHPPRRRRRVLCHGLGCTCQ